MNTFTDAQLELADSVGKIRQRRAKQNSYGRGHGESGYQLSRHVIGARAELAFALVRDLKWPNDENEFGTGFGDFDGVQVRGTTHNTGKLIIFESEMRQMLFVLVVVNDNRYRIAGSIQGEDGWNLGFVPSSFLRAGSPAQRWVDQKHLSNDFF